MRRDRLDLPVSAVSGNRIYARGHVAAVFRVETRSIAFLSEAEKKSMMVRLAWWMLKVEADFSIYRVCREYPADAYVRDTVSLIDERYANRGQWEGVLETHAERMQQMRSFTPEVYFVVSLRPSTRIPWARPSRDSDVISDAANAALETLSDQLPCRPATTHELQWLLRRAAVRGVREPDVDPHWYPPALALDGGVWEASRADVQRFVADVTERGRTLEVQSEDGESFQALLAMGALPKTSEYPGAADLLFSPLEALDFPVDAVAHVRWVDNKTMQTKADTAVKDARHSIEDRFARILDHKTARRGEESMAVQDYFASEPFPPMLDTCISLAVGARDHDELKQRVKRLRRAYGSIRLFQPYSLQVGLYNDHLVRPDGATVRDYRRYCTREQLAAMMPIGTNQAGAERGIYIGHTIPGAKRPIHYNPLEASQINRAGAVLLNGTLGAGKTMSLQLLLWLCAKRGSLVVDIDPRPDHAVERLPGMADKTRVISLADVDKYVGSLDPLVVAPPEMREELAVSYLMDITGDAKREWQTEIIAAVRQVLREENPCLRRVLDVLLESDEEEARAVGRDLNVWADWHLGRLAFSNGEGHQIASTMPVTTIKTSSLKLPPAGTPRADYDQSERLSVATMKLIVASAMRMMSFELSVHKVLALDEAHIFMTTSEGLRFLERVIRMMRSMNVTVILASQLLGDLQKLESLIGVRFSFRQETDEQARENLRMYGLDEDNERLITMLREFVDGQCFMRGLDGRVTRMKFDVVDPAFLKAADTNPNRVMDELEQLVS